MSVSELQRVAPLAFALALFGCSSSGSDAAPSAPADTTQAKPTTACGALSEPDCPLQAWMKANATSAVSSRDFTAIGKAFTRIAELRPPGFASWGAHAKAGLDAAQRSDLEGCRAACKACHEEHRARYRAEVRGRPLK